MAKFVIYSDGGARGNPGPGAFGFVIKSEVTSYPGLAPQSGAGKLQVTSEIPNLNIKIQNNTVYGSGYLGETTNNQAEYQGVLYALKYLLLHVTCYMLHDVEVECLLDSELIVKQMNGEYKIKNEGLKPLYWQIRQLIMDLGGCVFFRHIPRGQNKEADRLVNEAIDTALSKKIEL